MFYRSKFFKKKVSLSINFSRGFLKKRGGGNTCSLQKVEYQIKKNLNIPNLSDGWHKTFSHRKAIRELKVDYSGDLNSLLSSVSKITKI